MINIKIDENFDGISPKNFLKKRLDCPPNIVWMLIRKEKILINDKAINQNQILKNGDNISVLDNRITLRDRFHKQNLKAKEIGKKKIDSFQKDLKMGIVFENKDFILLNKKPNICVQGEIDNKNSIIYHLNFLKKKNKDTKDFIYTAAHRLDKNTSGALLVAKNQIALRKLNEIFSQKKIVKRYVALCNGHFEKNKDIVKIYMQKNEPNSKVKVSAFDKKTQKSKLTISKYRVLKKLIIKNQKFSLVEIEIETGFTHQIRVLMGYLNHPILLDEMYGNKKINDKFSKYLTRQFLHSSYLKFKYENKNYEFNIPLLKDLNKFLLI